MEFPWLQIPDGQEEHEHGVVFELPGTYRLRFRFPEGTAQVHQGKRLITPIIRSRSISQKGGSSYRVELGRSFRPGHYSLLVSVYRVGIPGVWRPDSDEDKAPKPPT